MDVQVAATQEWLNATYAGVAGWVRLEVDGRTGWSTIYGLRRGLQHELGISPVASGFGPETTRRFTAQIGSIRDDSIPQNTLLLLSGAMWCKGYPGLFPDTATSFESLAWSVSELRRDLGLSETPFVDVKVMSSLLSMDAYTVIGSGTSRVREAQQWLNGTYGPRRDFALVPCDGIHSRQVQTALIYGIQYELGFTDDVANGTLGPKTRTDLKAKGQVGSGTVDGTKRFVRAFQTALRLNGLDAPLSGTFDEATASVTREFQEFMELPGTGRGDYATWCALVVSSGDPSMATTGFDTKRQLSTSEAKAAYAAGYRIAGRYLVGAGKYITATELDALRTSGLRLAPIHQRFNDEPGLMTKENGRAHGTEALERCRVLGLPSGTTVYFTVDFDPTQETIDGPVLDYFRGVRDVTEESLNWDLRIGVYGTRNVCRRVTAEGLAKDAWVNGVSTGYSGNMGFAMPDTWRFNQIVETTTTWAGQTVGIDKDVVSRTAPSVDLSTVTAPPVEQDGSYSATGFDAAFEWLVRAEVRAERFISEQDTFLYPLKAYKPMVGSFILHWLQKHRYWDIKWQAYTPDPDTFAAEAQRMARWAAEDACLELAQSSVGWSGDVASFLDALSRRDLQHFAASLRGYETHGVPGSPNNYGMGDLGGWALDLLSLWGCYLADLETSPGLDLFSYMADRIGATSGAGADSPPCFSMADVVADGDAYLVARVKRDQSCTLTEALRRVWRTSTQERVRQFHELRFGSSGSNNVAAFSSLVDGIDVGVIDNIWFTTTVLSHAIEGARLPTQDEARTCAMALSAVLTAGGK